MIEHRDGDLLAQPDLTHIAHQANLYHCFGAGLAAAIERRFPYAAAADRDTVMGDLGKLGTYSMGKAAGGPAVVNLYTQRPAADAHGSLTDYAALARALLSLEAELRPSADRVVLGLPHGLGCGIAGGSWYMVQLAVQLVFKESPVRAVIVRLPVRAGAA